MANFPHISARLTMPASYWYALATAVEDAATSPKWEPTTRAAFDLILAAVQDAHRTGQTCYMPTSKPTGGHNG